MPKLSVIVIAFNNELYIEEALESLHQQTYQDLEVIVVNDASTDRTQSVIESYIQDKPKFSLLNLTTNSGGCSVPRNSGIEASSGTYLMFLDGDDWYTKDACEKMVRAMEEYDSEFIAGEVIRTNNYETWYKSSIFAKPKINYNIRRFTDALYDSLSVNKIYKRAFLDAHKLRFPEGIHYEDIVFTGQAYFLAERISIICEPIYYWRVVENAKEKSITNRRAEIDNLLNRLKAHRILDAFLLKHREYISIQKKNAKFLKHDLKLYMQDYKNNLSTYDDAFKTRFKEEVSTYLTETFKKEEFYPISEEIRISCFLLQKGYFDEFDAYMHYLNDEPQSLLRVVSEDTFFYLEFDKLNSHEKRYMTIKDLRFQIMVKEVSLYKGSFRVEIEKSKHSFLSDSNSVIQFFVENSSNHKKYPLQQNGNNWELQVIEFTSGNYHLHMDVALMDNSISKPIQAIDVLDFKPIRENHHTKLLETYISANAFVGFRVKENSKFKKIHTTFKRFLPKNISNISKKAQNSVKKSFKYLPIKKKYIYFESHMGKQYSDSPKYIYEELMNQNKNYTFIWSLTHPDETDIPGKHVKKVKKGSLSQLYYQARAKYWFDNQGIGHIMPKRKGQIYTQTWHGTPLKKMGYDKNIDRKSNDAKKLAHQVKQWDYFLSPNEYSTEIFRRAFEVKSPIWTIGYPRNDVLLNRSEEVNRTVRQTLHIAENKKVILYAPTFRDWDKNAHHKMSRDILALAKELSEEYVILVRLHYLDAAKVKHIAFPSNVINVSEYMDVQELYCTSDMLITDYSSVMFDYACLKKPMFFYCYDMEDYLSLRGTYFDLEHLPGKISKTVSELVADIQNGDIEEEKYETFFEQYCQNEKGTAAQEVIKRLHL